MSTNNHLVDFKGLARFFENLANSFIATKDKLGGIKVGKNLEVEEDGTLNAITNTASIKEDILYEGIAELSTTSSSITLSNSINSYNYLKFRFQINSGVIYTHTHIIDCSDLVSDNKVCFCTYETKNSSGDYNVYFRIQRTSSVTLEIKLTNSIGWETSSIVKIIGIY